MIRQRARLRGKRYDCAERSCPDLRAVHGRRCMRPTGLTVAMVVLYSLFACGQLLAQHSSGGSSGGSSGSSGGSHGGSSGGSSSAGSHSGGSSAGGSASHGSSSHSSGSHNSGSSASHAGAPSHSNVAHSTREPRVDRVPKNSTTTKAQPEKRSFFSFLRHHHHKHEPKPVADLRRRVCLNRSCQPCPVGQVHTGAGCATPRIFTNNTNLCSRWDLWSGAACLQHTRFLDSCSGLLAALQRQRQRMQAAESERRSACATGVTQECSELTSEAQSEASLYRALLDRYRQCQGSLSGPYTFGSHAGSFPFDPFVTGFEYR